MSSEGALLVDVTDPRPSAVRTPAEWEPHERTVICWPCRNDLYGELMTEAKAAHAEVARTVATYEPVTMIARPGRDAAEAARLCGESVEVLELPQDDSWFRDTGPIYVERDGRRIGTDWIFNSWGRKFAPYDADAAVARHYLEAVGHERRAVDMVLEGGSIVTDGQGTLVTTAACLLHPNRNPHLSRADIEARLSAELGAEVVVWLPFGLQDDDDTDGHVDNIAAFLPGGKLLMQGCSDPREPDHANLHADRRWAEASVDAHGRAIEIVEVPVLPFAEVGGQRVPVPYVNLYIGNGFALVPVCGSPTDADVCAIVAAALPDREVIPLDVGAVLAFGGGGIHCITQQVPVAPGVVDGGPAGAAG